MFMYMKRILISTILLLGMFGIRATAQEFPETEIRRMNLQVLEKIEKLEELSAIDGAVRAEEFMALFRDRKARVYNDLIGVSAESSLPLDEYVSHLRKMNDVQVSIFNVEKTKPFVSAGSLCVLVSFDKVITYRDPKNVIYSSVDFYGYPHRVEALFAYDDFDGTCHIESITGSLPDDAVLHPVDYLVFRPDSNMEDVRFRKAQVERKSGFYDADECGYLKYNSLAQAFLPAEAAQEDWFYMQNTPKDWDPDVFVETSVSNDRFLELDKKYKRFRAKVYNSAAPAGVFAVDGDFDKAYSVADELGVEFRFMPNIGNRLNVGVYGSLGMSYNYLDLALKGLSYEYEYSKSLLSYDFDVLGQRFHTVDAVLGGGLAVEYALSRRWTMDLTLGAKAYYNVYAKVGHLYCDYTFKEKESAPVRTVGFFREEGVVNRTDFKPDVWPCPLSAVAGVGMGYSLSKSALFTFGLKYEQGLNCYYQSEMNPYREYKRPVRYSSAKGMDVVHWSFTDCFNLTKKAIWIDLGFIFKF